MAPHPGEPFAWPRGGERRRHGRAGKACPQRHPQQYHPKPRQQRHIILGRRLVGGEAYPVEVARIHGFQPRIETREQAEQPQRDPDPWFGQPMAQQARQQAGDHHKVQHAKIDKALAEHKPGDNRDQQRRRADPPEPQPEVTPALPLPQHQTDAHDGQKERHDKIARPDPAPVIEHVETGQVPVGEIKAGVKGHHGEDGDTARLIQPGQTQTRGRHR